MSAKIPATITWEGLKKRTIVAGRLPEFDAISARVGKKAIVFQSEKTKWRIEKLNSNWRSDLHIEMWDYRKPHGDGFYTSIYLNADNLESLVAWLAEGQWIPPQRRGR